MNYMGDEEYERIFEGWKNFEYFHAFELNGHTFEDTVKYLFYHKCVCTRCGFDLSLAAFSQLKVFYSEVEMLSCDEFMIKKLLE